jgi:hypothetical protein
MKAMRVLSGLLWIALVSFLGAGCTKNAGTTSPSTAPRPVAIVVFKDSSASISGYPHGGAAGMTKCYTDVAQAFIKPILQWRYRIGDPNKISVICYDFVDTYDTLFSDHVSKWEQVRGQLTAVLVAPPYSHGEASGTNFSTMVSQVEKYCDQHQDCDVYVLVLSDFHNDDSRKRIQEAAKHFKDHNPGNLKFLLGAPAEVDHKMRWRENMQTDLAPLGNVRIANSSDYRDAVNDALKTMKGEDN